MEVLQSRSVGEGKDARSLSSSSQASSRQDVTIPLARVTTCGGLVIEVLHTVQQGPDGQPQPVYGPTDATWLARKSASTGLTLLAMLASQPHCFASKDWLSEKLGHPPTEEDEGGEGLKRLDNVVYLLRHLLYPPRAEETPQERRQRRQLVSYERASSESGPGYRLAGLPLLWLDVVEIGAHLKRARRLEQFGEDGLSEWQAAHELAKQGSFLPQEVYSDWATWRRQEVEAQWWDCVQVLCQRYREQGAAGEEQALQILREYWLQHVTSEDALRPLLELLGKREWYGQAEEYYRLLCKALEEEGAEPDRRTQETIEFVRALQIRRKPNPQSLPEHYEGQVAHSPFPLTPRDILSGEETSKPEEMDMDRLRRKLLRDLLNVSGTTLLLSPYTSLDLDVLERLTSALKASSSVDASTLAALGAITGKKRYDFVHLEGATWHELLYEVSGHLKAVTQLLERSQPQSTYTHLCLIAAETALLIGDILFNAGNGFTAEKYYDAAFQTAQESQDEVLQAVILGRKSFVSIYDRVPEQALPLLEEAHRLTAGNAADVICSWLWAIQGEAYANMRDIPSALDALSRAQDTLDRGLPGKISYAFAEDVAYALHSPLKLLGFRGTCFLRLRQPQEAQSALNTYLASLDALEESAQNHHRSITLADLALTYVQQASVKKACEYANQSLSYIEQTKSVRVFQRVLSVRRALEPWNHTPYVRELDGRMATVLSLLVPREMP